MKYSLKLIFIALLFLLNTKAYSCSCAAESIESQIEVAEAIIQGTLIKAEYQESSEYFQQKKYTFDVDKSYKGNVPKQFSVYTSVHGSACGLNLSVGIKYVILVSENKQVWSCQGHEEWYPKEYDERRNDIYSSGLLKELRGNYRGAKADE